MTIALQHRGLIIQGVKVDKSRESFEVVVCRVDCTAMLQGQRRNMGITGQVAACTGPGKETAQDFPVTSSWNNCYQNRPIQPIIHIIDSSLDGQWLFKYSRVSGYSK